MLLRTLSQHVKDQNWFAVFIDFLIVVVGVFIGIQVSNWNDSRQARYKEKAVLAQLEEEFVKIQTDLEKQITYRKQYVKNIGTLIKVIEGTETDVSDAQIKQALNNMRSIGRRPAQSSAFLQMMSSGELSTLSNETLQQLLIRYDAVLRRDDFINPILMDLMIEELSTNEYVDLDIHEIRSSGAQVDKKTDNDDPLKIIRSYDLDGLRQYEKRYETIYMGHNTLLSSEKSLLEMVNEILKEIPNRR